MAKQINPSLARLWQKHDERRYGAEKHRLIKVTSEADHRALDLLESGLTNDQFLNLEQLAKIKREPLQALLEQLGPLVTTTSSFMPSLTPREVEQRFTEILRIYANGDQDPALVMQQRKLAKVYVSTIGRAGLVAARGLYNLGVGLIATFDGTRVKAKDTSELGYRVSQIGIPRHQALRELLDKPKSAFELHTKLNDSLSKVDCALLIQSDVINPESYQPWMTRDAAHIAITFIETGARVSQLVVPGITPCLACNELQRMTEDSSWLQTATQLTGFDRDFADTSLLLTTLGIALGRIVKYLDAGLLSYLDNRELVIDHQTGYVKEFATPEINCGCRPELDIPRVGDLKLS